MTQVGRYARTGVGGLFAKSGTNNVRFVGAGAGLDNPPIATVPLEKAPAPGATTSGSIGPVENLTIAEAKKLLAKSLGVDESIIKITVEA